MPIDCARYMLGHAPCTGDDSRVLDAFESPAVRAPALRDTRIVPRMRRLTDLPETSMLPSQPRGIPRNARATPSAQRGAAGTVIVVLVLIGLAIWWFKPFGGWSDSGPRVDAVPRAVLARGSL